jgi:thioredoxin 1
MKRFDIKHLNVTSFKQMMVNEKPTVIEFFNPSCHLCMGLTPILEQLCQQYGNDFDFAELDVAQHPRVAKTFNIQGVPELFIIKKGFVQQIPYPDDESASEKSGYSKDYIVEHLEKIKQFLNHMEDQNA